jgi:hypothetical protein
VTYTASEKVTVTPIDTPALYAPLAVADVTFETVGLVVSTTIAAFAANEPAEPGHAKRKAAAYVAVAVSTILPPLRATGVTDW